MSMYFQKHEQLGTTDPDPEPRQHYEVHCGNCHWWGMLDQMKTIYKPSPLYILKSGELDIGDVIPTPACPICLSDQWLEYRDEEETSSEHPIYPPTVCMARLVLSARYRNKCHATVLELLRCQTLQSENLEEE